MICNYSIKNCKRCNEPFKPNSGRQLYCEPCQREVNTERCKDRYRKTYQRKGYNQYRENNNNWKNGIGVFKDIAYNSLPRLCNRCGSTRFLVVHHRDHNKSNNDLSNLEILCKSCHQKHHKVYLNFSKKV